MKTTDREISFIQNDICNLQIGMEQGVLCEVLFVTSVEENGTPYPDIAVVRQQILEYLGGSRKDFSLRIQPEGTQFQKEVWNALQEIPYGETRTYQEIAIQIGRPKACRAVGMAAHNNPIPIIIPCHRVIGANGSLTGFAGGLDLKQELLDLEKRNTR